MISRYTCFVVILFLLFFSASAQVVTISPSSATGDDEVKVVFDATQGTGDLVGAVKVYMHSGIITDSPGGTEWQHVIGNWGLDDGIGQMTKVTGEGDKWEITLSPTIREYYNAGAGDNIFRLAMVFRNADGSGKGAGTPGDFTGGTVAENGDIFIDLAVDAYVSITSPGNSEIFILNGESIAITATSSATATTLSIAIDEGSGFEEKIMANNVESLNYDFTPSASGNITIKVQAEIGGNPVEMSSDYNIFIRNAPTVAAVPAGLRQGINYDADPTKSTLVLFAPEKEFVYVVGDFNNWEVNAAYLMNRSPDGQVYWLEISGLVAGQEYIFQYWVDGVVKVGDPYADKVADPYNDQFITESVYPGLINYDKTDNGIATVLQTDQVDYTWSSSEDSWIKPKKEDLVVYELLVRDFLGSHDYKDLADTLGYLKSLGVNAIELMPIMEFEGNESWGYNPSYFLAPDKYYGTKNDLKSFIETAHQQGFAVILDMVLNHAFGQNAMVRMYWDEQANQPAENSPWFNTSPTHPFNVGFDFNHESIFTQQFVDSVNSYWLQEYHFDGYRFDLSKGFTQTNNPDNVQAWSAFDQSRIDILIRMANKIWETDNDAYVILEHFADFSEETALVAEGMMVWRNKNFDYREVIAGNTGNSFSGADAKDWVSYMESHDEERLMFVARGSGKMQATYDIKNLTISLNRVKAAAAFFYLVPGPKMMWQFQELGYDIDINLNGRTGNKPLPWGDNNLGYYEDGERLKLFKTHAAILKIRNDFPEVINEGNFSWTDLGDLRKINITHANLDITVIGNFGLTANKIDPGFSKTGMWYDYFNQETIDVSDVNAQIELSPGEFHIFTDKQLQAPEAGLVDVFKPVVITDPVNFNSLQEIKIIFDATAADPDGTLGLVGAAKVYMHAGVILDGPGGTTWSNIVGNLLDDGIGQMTKIDGESDKWEITLTSRSYFSVENDKRIYRIGMYFRDATNENVGKGPDGTEIFISVDADEGQVIVSTDPQSFNATSQVNIIFDAAAADPAGTAGLVGAGKVYMHSGVITDNPNGTSWEYVVGNWGIDDGVGEMTKVDGTIDKWELAITPRSYYGVPAETTIYRLGMVFRNADGSREGKDIGGADLFINVDQSIATGINFKKFTGNVVVYPNPANNKIDITIDGINGNSVRLSLMNLLGQVSNNVLLITGTRTSWVFNTSELKPGIYFLQVINGSERHVEKVLIER